MNEGIVKSTNNKYLNTECGINRVFIRSTLTPGTIKLAATRDGLKPGTVQVQSKRVDIVNGLMRDRPQTMARPVPVR